ncbi:amidohydrolase family protein [Paraburkholderia dilworthii]|uniref:amidohydrolase family protein n=1 Tax=Paraburkholderia dilworthii TaxID=948106 RepID=UPI0004063FD5|nr:amidohydrolase family protein [Paraburkholderia dilworthii]
MNAFASSPPFARGGVDTHAHVFEQGLPLTCDRRYAPTYDATLDDYLPLLNEHGITHAVLVQPSFLGTDNRYLLQALSANSQRLRGVAVVAPEITANELADLHRRGVTGIRLNLMEQALPDLRAQPWTSLLDNVARLDWHVELHRNAADLAPMIDRLLERGLRVAVDHFGRPDPALGTQDSGFKALLGFGKTGRVWVKVSGAYRCAAPGSPFVRDATTQLIEQFGAERLMWGSDWPHTQYETVTSYGDALSTLLNVGLDSVALHSVGLDSAALGAILRTTALSFYGFDVEPVAHNASPTTAALQRATY